MAENTRNNPSPVNFCMQFYAQFNISSFASVFHILGVISNFISPHFNALLSTLRCYLSYFARMQFIFYFNQSSAFIIQVLTTFLQLKYQGNDQNKSPFETHPKAMLVAVSSSVAYYLSCIALLQFPLRRFAVVAHHCLVLSGNASVAALVSVLLPDSFSPFVYAIFASLSASELLYWFYQNLVREQDDAEFQPYRRRVCRFFNNICRAVGNSSRLRSQILPI